MSSNLEEMDRKHYVPIGLPLIAKEPTEIKAGDKIAHVRSLIRHDGIAVSREVMKLFSHETTEQLRYDFLGFLTVRSLMAISSGSGETNSFIFIMA